MIQTGIYLMRRKCGLNGIELASIEDWILRLLVRIIFFREW